MAIVRGQLKQITDKPITDDQIWVRSQDIYVYGDGAVVDEMSSFTIHNGNIEFKSLPGTGVIVLLDNAGYPTKTIPYIVPESVGTNDVYSLKDAILAGQTAESASKREIERIAGEVVNSVNEVKRLRDEATASASNAKQSETNAAKSATAAKSSETNAAKSASNAKTSETNSAKSATAASTSSINAANSAAAASTSETNAKVSADKAGASAASAEAYVATASTKAKEATSSADAAKISEDNAATSAKNAKTSETNASSSKTAAAASASNAKTSETNAKGSADKASASAASAEAYVATASTKAEEASSSADAAKTSEMNSAASAREAKESETNASSSRTSAATSASNAKQSETNSKRSETIAEQAAQDAATSATQSKTAESNSSTHAKNAKNSSDDSAESAQKSENSASAAAGTEKRIVEVKGEIDSISTTVKADADRSSSSADAAKISEDNAAQSAIQARNVAGGVVDYSRLDDDLKRRIDDAGTKEHTHVSQDIDDAVSRINQTGYNTADAGKLVKLNDKGKISIDTPPQYPNDIVNFDYFNKYFAFTAKKGHNHDSGDIKDAVSTIDLDDPSSTVGKVLKADENGKFTIKGTPVDFTDIANKEYVDIAYSDFLNESTSVINNTRGSRGSSRKLISTDRTGKTTLMGNPLNENDIANKGYVDESVSGIQTDNPTIMVSRIISPSASQDSSKGGLVASGSTSVFEINNTGPGKINYAHGNNYLQFGNGGEDALYRLTLQTMPSSGGSGGWTASLSQAGVFGVYQNGQYGWTRFQFGTGYNGSTYNNSTSYYYPIPSTMYIKTKNNGTGFAFIVDFGTFSQPSEYQIVQLIIERIENK